MKIPVCLKQTDRQMKRLTELLHQYCTQYDSTSLDKKLR